MADSLLLKSTWKHILSSLYKWIDKRELADDRNQLECTIFIQKLNLRIRHIKDPRISFVRFKAVQLSQYKALVGLTYRMLTLGSLGGFFSSLLVGYFGVVSSDKLNVAPFFD